MHSEEIPILELLGIDEIWHKSLQVWAKEKPPLSIEDAIKVHLVPSVLRKTTDNDKEEQKRKTAWMYIARFVGEIMSQRRISDKETAQLVTKADNGYWLDLYNKDYSNKTVSEISSSLVQNMAPHYAAGRIRKQWDHYGSPRWELRSEISAAIALNCIDIDIGTDHLTWLNLKQQAYAFAWYCNCIKNGDSNSDIKQRQVKLHQKGLEIK